MPDPFDDVPDTEPDQEVDETILIEIPEDDDPLDDPPRLVPLEPEE